VGELRRTGQRPARTSLTTGRFPPPLDRGGIRKSTPIRYKCHDIAISPTCEKIFFSRRRAASTATNPASRVGRWIASKCKRLST
jgi:hypothetical protein